MINTTAFEILYASLDIKFDKQKLTKNLNKKAITFIPLLSIIFLPKTSVVISFLSVSKLPGSKPCSGACAM